jgi:hypothetical protein
MSQERGTRDFQQLIVDAVELAGAISPSLKAELVSVLGAEFPSDISSTIDRQAASLPAVLRMFVYARREADQLSTLQNARSSLDMCVGFLIGHASCSRAGLMNRYH